IGVFCRTLVLCKRWRNVKKSHGEPSPSLAVHSGEGCHYQRQRILSVQYKDSLPRQIIK
uniref:Uncharacterized protein n=1 Tax=Meleagris gallopavo TaxID=9103 RepID=A0A803Y7C3_MELGA